MTGDDTVRLTYTELAAARGVSLGAARRMVYRHRWPKQIGNDGLSRIAVPREFLTRDPTDVSTGDSPDVSNDVRDDVTPHAPELRVVALDEAVEAFAGVTRDAIADVSKDVILTLREGIAALQVQICAERERADRAEERMREAELRTREIEGRAGELQQKLEAEMIEHRRLVNRLTEQLTVRRSWWRWRRRS